MAFHSQPPMQAGLKVRNVTARAEGPGTMTQIVPWPVRPKLVPEFCQCRDLECAGMTALWNWQTCLPVRKRRHVAALQKRTLPELLCMRLFRPFRACGFCHSDPGRCPGLSHRGLSALPKAMLKPSHSRRFAIATRLPTSRSVWTSAFVRLRRDESAHSPPLFLVPSVKVTFMKLY